MLTEHGIYLRERLLAMSDRALRAPRCCSPTSTGPWSSSRTEKPTCSRPVCGYNAGWEEALGVEPERIRVIHNGVDPARIDVWPEPQGPPTIGFIGRIDPLKDVLTLIQAFARVRLVDRDARLRLWGPATSPAYLEQCQIAVTDLGLSDAVTFEGSTNDIAAAYGVSHVIGLSSISEAFPYTAVEAMLAARPIVATAVGGVAEALGPAQCRGTATVVEPGDPGAMAEALIAVPRRVVGRAQAPGRLAAAAGPCRCSRRNGCSTTTTTSTTGSSRPCARDGGAAGVSVPDCRHWPCRRRTGPWRTRSHDRRHGPEDRGR